MDKNVARKFLPRRSGQICADVQLIWEIYQVYRIYGQKMSVLQKTDLSQKGTSSLKKKEAPAAACSAVKRAWGYRSILKCNQMNIIVTIMLICIN